MYVFEAKKEVENCDFKPAPPEKQVSLQRTIAKKLATQRSKALSEFYVDNPEDRLCFTAYLNGVSALWAIIYSDVDGQISVAQDYEILNGKIVITVGLAKELASKKAEFDYTLTGFHDFKANKVERGYVSLYSNATPSLNEVLRKRDSFLKFMLALSGLEEKDVLNDPFVNLKKHQMQVWEYIANGSVQFGSAAEAFAEFFVQQSYSIHQLACCYIGETFAVNLVGAIFDPRSVSPKNLAESDLKNVLRRFFLFEYSKLSSTED